MAIYAGDHPIVSNHRGCSYTICKDRVFICELTESESPFFFPGEDGISYSVNDGGKVGRRISKDTFDKYLEEANKEGAKIQSSPYNYVDNGYGNTFDSCGQSRCPGCSGCIAMENNIDSSNYGDRTYLIRIDDCTTECTKCGVHRSEGWGSPHDNMQRDYCPACGRIINRKKQDETLRQITEEDNTKRELRKRQEEARERERRLTPEMRETERFLAEWFSRHGIKDPLKST